jgi:hypothetical protein
MPTDLLGHTVPRLPSPWRAWEETSLCVARCTRQPARLSLAWNSEGLDAPWMAQFDWVQNVERVHKHDSAGLALAGLWEKIDSRYSFFQTPEDARRAPHAYPDNYWFSDMEQALIGRLTQLGGERCDSAVTLILTYGVNDEVEPDLTTRLICHAGARTITGTGLDLLKACQDLYPRAARQLTETPFADESP